MIPTPTAYRRRMLRWRRLALALPVVVALAVVYELLTR